MEVLKNLGPAGGVVKSLGPSYFLFWPKVCLFREVKGHLPILMQERERCN